MAVLEEQCVIEVVPAAQPGDGLAHNGAEHERRDHRELVGHLKTMRRAVRGARTTALKHALMPTAARTILSAAVRGSHDAGDPREEESRHAAEEQGRGEDPAAPSPAVGGDGRHELGHHEGTGDLPDEPVVEGKRKIVVAQTKDPGVPVEEEDCAAESPRDEGSAERPKPRWQAASLANSGAKRKGEGLEGDADQGCGGRNEGEDQVHEPRDAFHGRKSEGRLPSQECLDDERPEHGGQNDSAQDPAAELVVEKLFQDEGDGSERSVERRGEGRRGAGGCRQPPAVFGTPMAAARFEAIPPPTKTDGPSRPRLVPPPRVRTPPMNFTMIDLRGRNPRSFQ